MQPFKGDAIEAKFFSVFRAVQELISIERDNFMSGLFTSFPLGDVLFNSNRAPLTNAITQQVFREAFSEIFTEAFVRVGTAEAYLTVFRKIFGDDVDVTFTVPGPGQLNIDIVASGLEITDFVSRYISGNEYFFDNVVDDLGNQLVFQTIRGMDSQYELERMLFEMVPGGIYTLITLDVA